MMSGRDAEVLRLHYEGRWPTDISATLGVPRSRVYRVLAAAKVKPNPSPTRPVYVNRSEVEAMLRAGERTVSIAEWMGITQQRVSQIAVELGLRRRRRRSPNKPRRRPDANPPDSAQ